MITLRKATFADHTAIAALHAASWKKNYRGIYSDAYLDHDVDRDRLDAWHERLQTPAPNQHITVAVQEGKIVGFACLFLNDHPTFGALLDNLHVSTEQRKSGIGKQLMQACASIILEQAGNKGLYLWVYALNGNARKMYEHVGAQNVETEEKVHPDGSVALACRYVWEDAARLL